MGSLAFSGRLSLLFRIPILIALIFSFPAAAYQEAPILAERVQRGELPPVAMRLPEDPAVIEPVERIGTYGGAWRRVTLGARDILLSTRLGYEPLVRWDRAGTGISSGLAKSWEVLDGGRTYVFHLRHGVKWSDGQALTSEDFVFYIEDVISNRELFPVFPAWLMSAGESVIVTAPDPFTVRYHFAEPYGIFLEMVCYRGNELLLPKHYLKKFHVRYAERTTLDRKVKERGLATWYQLFMLKADANDNPELPSWRPFVIKIPAPAARMVAERNPYYWKVDPEGNQLPYLDQIVYADVQDVEMATFKAMAGEVDFQARRIDPANFTLFMENRHRGKYRVLRDPVPDPTVVYINQYSKDEELRPILQDRRFRVALSVAINRDEIVNLLYSGMAVPSRGVGSPYDPYYQAEFDQRYIQYDPGESNRLLDEVGLRKDAQGLRHLPNGKVFRQTLNVFPSEMGTATSLWQLVADYWREVGLDFVVKMDAPTLSVLQVCNGNSDFWAYAADGMHWILDPVWYIPWQTNSYSAPLYGRYVYTNGKAGVKPPPEFQQLVDWYRELCSTMDAQRRLELGQRILGQCAEECYTIGICRHEQVTIVRDNFRNVPEHIIHTHKIMTEGYLNIEQFYIDHEKPPRGQHAGGSAHD